MATRPDHPSFAVEGYTVAEVLMCIRFRLYSPEEPAQPETARPRKTKTRKKTGKKTVGKAHRETAVVRQKRGAHVRYVSENGLPPRADPSTSVYFAKGAHPAPRFWYRTPEDSTAPYVPLHRSAP